MCVVGCFCCLVVFGVVSSGVDDDCRVFKVVFLYVLESPSLSLSFILLGSGPEGDDVL